ncbi:MAG: ATP-grasp domain-containing protein [Dissulfurispiraceae bacterium]
MSRQRPKIFILDGMWNKTLAAVRSLGARGFHVTVGERTPLAAALFSRYCSKRLIYPSPSEKPQAFLDNLENELARGEYDALFPMEWTTQALLTDPFNRRRLERYTRIPFISADVAELVNDKSHLMRYAMACGIDVPGTIFTEKNEDLDLIADTIDFPVVIKPRISSGSRGVVYAKDKRELVRHYPLVHVRYPFPIIQEYIPGSEVYGVAMLLNFQSQVRASFVYKRIRSYPVAGGPSTLRVSVKRDDLSDIAGHLLRALNWSGIAHVEFKIDPRSGQPKLLEVNPRFWGSLALAIQTGIDFPFLLYRMAMDGDVQPVGDYADGVMRRWLIPGDLLHFIHNPQRFRLKPGFFDFRMKDDIISLNDPLPTLGRLLSVFTLLFDKEMRGLMKR